MTTAIETEPVKPPIASTPMALIAMAVERGVDPDQLGKLLDLQERWERNRAAETFADALTAFQQECPIVAKGNAAKDRGGNTLYNFASFDDVMRVAGPILSQHRIVVTFSSEDYDKGIRIICRVRVGIHFEDHRFTFPIPAMNQLVNDTQKYGAALKYAERYAICGALNIVCGKEDNDASTQMETLSNEQISKVTRLFGQCKEAGKPVDVKKFYEWIGVNSVREIPADRYADVVRLLQGKLNGKGGGE